MVHNKDSVLYYYSKSGLKFYPSIKTVVGLFANDQSIQVSTNVFKYIFYYEPFYFMIKLDKHIAA